MHPPRDIPWHEGSRLDPPADGLTDGTDLLVTVRTGRIGHAGTIRARLAAAR
ncbi:hypothetical protein ACIRYZ_08585 [Kitasatospora sp. NPDC101155]|uniref:hypothetical protein n=1 Tax=Kitasatospora sp. NPDC101155 TaxID=3364097 RepID=UPI0037F408B4